MLFVYVDFGFSPTKIARLLRKDEYRWQANGEV